MPINNIYYSSITTWRTHPYGCTKISKTSPAPPPSSHFRPKWTQWDARSSDSCATMDEENTTMSPSDMFSRTAVQYTSHVLHMPTIGKVVQNEWSVQSLKKPGQWLLTPKLPFGSGEKQLIPQSIFIKDHRMKASKEITAMAIIHHGKCHTRCCTDLANRRMMLVVMMYSIKPLSTIYIDWDGTPVYSFPKFSTARASSIQGQSPAWQ